MTERLKTLIAESKRWSTAARAGDLPPMVYPILMNVFQVNCGFFVYRRRIINPSRPLVYHAFGELSGADQRLQETLDSGDWVTNLHHTNQLERWLDVEQSPSTWRELFRAYGIRRVGLWPIRFDGRMVGAMVLARTTDSVEDDHDDISSCATLLSLAMNLIVARRVAEMDSRQDSLTGMWNRRGFESAWPDWKTQALNEGRQIVIGILDVNDFKQINDSLGHIYGDEYLVEIAQSLNVSLGADGLKCRWGGDEFAFACTADGRVAEVKRRLALEMANLSQSVSLGIAIFGEDGESLQDCLLVADSRMYEEKEEQRKHTALMKQ